MTRQKRKDALAWGIILIVIGVVILLSNIHITGWDFWEFFARLWPCDPDTLGTVEALLRDKREDRRKET